MRAARALSIPWPIDEKQPQEKLIEQGCRLQEFLYGEAIDGALAKLAHQAYGPVLLGIVAAGLEIAPGSGFPGSRALEALRVHVPGDRELPAPAHHRGEEWIYVLRGVLDTIQGGHPLPSILAAMFLLAVQTTLNLIKSYNSGTQFATADVLDSLWNYVAGTLCPIAAGLAVVGGRQIGAIGFSRRRVNFLPEI